jgi:hypothetical protein
VTERLLTFAFHAERLEQDLVWERTRRVLDHLEAREGRGTLFVHPLSAIEQGVDISARVGELLDRGHEVGQHTHFYGERPAGDSGKPPSDLSPGNIRRCLDRDLAFLQRAGAEPRGFTSGGWAIVPEVARWLEERRFVYDCSYRSFDLRYVSGPAVAGASRRPERVGGLLRLPTTIPLRDAFIGIVTRQRLPLSIDDISYEIVYTHDYDLAAGLRSRASRAVISSWSRRPGRWVTAASLAERIGDGRG